MKKYLRALWVYSCLVKTRVMNFDDHHSHHVHLVELKKGHSSSQPFFSNPSSPGSFGKVHSEAHSETRNGMQVICYGSAPQEPWEARQGWGRSQVKVWFQEKAHKSSGAYIIPQFGLRSRKLGFCTPSVPHPHPHTHTDIDTAIGDGREELNSLALWSLHRSLNSAPTTGSHRCQSLAVEPGEEGNGGTELGKTMQQHCWLYFYK